MRFEFAPTDNPDLASAEALQSIAHDVNRIAEEITDDGIRADGGVSAEESERPAFIDPQTESVECFFCGQLIEDMSRVEGIDISEPDAYYPKMRPVCSQHDTGGLRRMSVECPHEAERELRDEPGGDWEPEPATLREGETRDDTAHAARNRAMHRIARIEGVTEGDDGE